MFQTLFTLPALGRYLFVLCVLLMLTLGAPANQCDPDCEASVVESHPREVLEQMSVAKAADSGIFADQMAVNKNAWQTFETLMQFAPLVDTSALTRTGGQSQVRVWETW